MERPEDFDEFDEAELDAIIEELLEMAEYYGDGAEPKEVDPDKVERVRQLSEIIKTLVRGDRVKVQVFDWEDICPSSRGIGIAGNNVTIENTEALALILRTASVVEVSPRTDGRADLNMTFDNLTVNGASQTKLR